MGDLHRRVMVGGGPSTRGLRLPNERSVRISRTTLYRAVAGLTPGRERTEKVSTQRVETGQPKCAVQVRHGRVAGQSFSSEARLRQRIRSLPERPNVCGSDLHQRPRSPDGTP
jgi:hypothetical protein